MKQSKVTETIRSSAVVVCAAAVALGTISPADAKPNLADEAGRAEAAQVVQQNMQQQVLDKLQKAYGRSFEGVQMELLKQRSLDPQNLLRFLLTAEELDHCLLLVMLDAETGAVLDMRLENQLATTDDMVRNKYATVLRNATTGQTLALQSGDFIPQVGQGGSRSGGAVDGSRLVPFAPYFPWVAEPRHPLTDAEATSDDTSSADDNTPRYTVTSAPASTPSPAPSAPAPVVLPSAPAASVPAAPSAEPLPAAAPVAAAPRPPRPRAPLLPLNPPRSLPLRTPPSPRIPLIPRMRRMSQRTPPPPAPTARRPSPQRIHPLPRLLNPPSALSPPAA